MDLTVYIYIYIYTNSFNMCFPLCRETAWQSRSTLTVHWVTMWSMWPQLLSCAARPCEEERKCVRKSLDSGAYLSLNPRFLQHPPQPRHPRTTLPRQRPPQQPRYPGHEAQVHLSVLPGLDGHLLWDAPDNRACPVPPERQRPGRTTAAPVPSLLLSVCHHVLGSVSHY